MKYSEVIVSAKAHSNFQCLGVMLAKRWPQPFRIMVFTALKVKVTLEPNPQMFPESNATIANFTRANNTRLFSSGCKFVAMETADFLTAVLFVWEKSHVLCKTTVGVRKIVTTLERCVIGLFGWMNQSFRSLCVSADKLIARTQF